MALFKNSKSNKIFWAVGLFCVGLLLFAIGYDYYEQWKGERNVERLAEFLRETEKAKYEKQAADTIGGKTPQETLDLFIQAVEKGDYDLASKYFVIEKQEEWKKDLIEVAENKKINTLLEPLLDAKNSKGDYSDSKDKYFIHIPILVSFVRYPSGNWKIEEI